MGRRKRRRRRSSALGLVEALVECCGAKREGYNTVLLHLTSVAAL